MPRASDIQLDDHNMSFLLIGENGSHKTRFIGSIPPSFGEVLVFDFDKGMASIRGSTNIEYFTYKDVAPGALAKPEEGRYEYGTAWLEFQKKFNEVAGLINEGKAPWKVFCVDSYSFASEALENRIAKTQGRVSKGANGWEIKPLEIQHWQIFNRDMRNFINTFVGWPGVKIVTAHVERAENVLSGAMEQLPLANAKMQSMLPNFFDEVYFCDVSMAADPKDATRKVQVPTLHTVKDAVRKNARSRWFVPQGTPTDWSALMRAVKSAGAGSTPTKV